MGSAAGTEIHGIVYSGGNVEFNPVIVDGGVVAFQIQTQSTSASYGVQRDVRQRRPAAGISRRLGQYRGSRAEVVHRLRQLRRRYGGGSPCQ